MKRQEREQGNDRGVASRTLRVTVTGKAEQP